MKLRDFEKILSEVGFSLVRLGGNGHRVWGDGARHISVPNGREINRMVARRLLKELNYSGRVQEINYHG